MATIGLPYIPLHFLTTNLKVYKLKLLKPTTINKFLLNHGTSLLGIALRNTVTCQDREVEPYKS